MLYDQAKSEPRVSVVVRSLGRLWALTELLERLVSQEHDSFEVVIIEQTQNPGREDLRKLKPFLRDPRIRWIKQDPLGGPRARNEGVRRSRGSIIILIDDDDLPVKTDWISAHEAYYRDPNLIGLTARHIWQLGEPCPYPGWRILRRRCLSYSILKTPYTFARFDSDIHPVMWIHGTNASFRREKILQADLWDETVKTQDEHSLAFKIHKTMSKDEYLAFKAYPLVLRRKNIEGGMEKRQADVVDELRSQLQFFHRVIGRYFPLRFRFFYPAYLMIAVWRPLAWLWHDIPTQTGLKGKIKKSIEVFEKLPVVVLEEFRR